jgi:hypothetical protein
MKNFLLGAATCYLLITPTARAGFSNDIESIVNNLNKITRSISNMEILLNQRFRD